MRLEITFSASPMLNLSCDIGDIAGVFIVGLAFGAKSADDWSGLGLTATYSGLMLKKDIPNSANKWFYWLRTIAQRNAKGTKYHLQGQIGLI